MKSACHHTININRYDRHDIHVLWDRNERKQSTKRNKNEEDKSKEKRKKWQSQNPRNKTCWGKKWPKWRTPVPLSIRRLGISVGWVANGATSGRPRSAFGFICLIDQLLVFVGSKYFENPTTLDCRKITHDSFRTAVPFWGRTTCN